MAKLINRTALKKFILEEWPRRRHHKITRVSPDAMTLYEIVLRERIRGDIDRHPSLGRTFKP